MTEHHSLVKHREGLKITANDLRNLTFTVLYGAILIFLLIIGYLQPSSSDWTLQMWLWTGAVVLYANRTQSYARKIGRE